ncbi:MAG TPA: tetratricopeptide repeat protein [Povalibacter sp.]|nr:tetratricopeptide repeat protein [Povalibacter sp.]
MSKAVGVPLQAAQKAMANKQWDAALAEIKKAQAVEKRTPAEDYQIDEFLGYIYLQQKKYAQAAPVFERMLNSGLMPADQVDDRIKAVAQIYFQEKEDKKSIEWTKKWLAKHPADEDMGVLLAQAYYRLNDYKNAAAQMSSVVANIEKSGQTPKENYLQIVLSSQYKQDNKEGTTEALKKLVRYYPSNDYWANLVDTYRRQTNSDRVTLGFYRLMNDIGILKEKGDFMEMSQLAIEAGVPGEAEAVMKNGMENGPLKSTDKTEQGRYQRLFDAAKKQAAADRPSLGQQAKDAEKASQGQPSVGVGQAYLSYGMYDEAIAAIQSGLKKGGVTDVDEAQISLGIAQLKKGQKDAARQTFKAVKADSKWADLASLWVLRTYNG